MEARIPWWNRPLAIDPAHVVYFIFAYKFRELPIFGIRVTLRGSKKTPTFATQEYEPLACWEGPLGSWWCRKPNVLGLSKRPQGGTKRIAWLNAQNLRFCHGFLEPQRVYRGGFLEPQRVYCQNPGKIRGDSWKVLLKMKTIYQWFLELTECRWLGEWRVQGDLLGILMMLKTDSLRSHANLSFRLYKLHYGSYMRMMK